VKSFLVVAIVAAIAALAVYRAGAEFSLLNPEVRQVPAVSVLTDRGKRVALRAEALDAIVVFGYTRCHDVCSLLLSRAFRDSSRKRVLFITVDPDRDRPAILTAYLRSWPGVEGITASPVTMARVYSAFTGSAPPRVIDDHTSQIFRVDERDEIAPLSQS